MTVQISWMFDRLHLTDEFQSTALSKCILRTAARHLLHQPMASINSTMIGKPTQTEFMPKHELME
jgi:hypothetical protein